MEKSYSNFQNPGFLWKKVIAIWKKVIAYGKKL
jgi:hypothetical protein